MKSHFWTFTLLIGGLLLAPAAMAQQFGMDDAYNQGLTQAQSAAAAANSTADTGDGANTTAESAWQDMSYIQGQQAAVQVPGSLQAPLQSSPFGTVSTYMGNTGQFLKGSSGPLGASLPKTQTGLNAINGGYFGPACTFTGAGGFGGFGFSRIYPLLPPTSTSLDVQLNNCSQ
jgi:hypothetical protein